MEPSSKVHQIKQLRADADRSAAAIREVLDEEARAVAGALDELATECTMEGVARVSSRVREYAHMARESGLRAGQYVDPASFQTRLWDLREAAKKREAAEHLALARENPEFVSFEKAVGSWGDQRHLTELTEEMGACFHETDRDRVKSRMKRAVERMMCERYADRPLEDVIRAYDEMIQATERLIEKRFDT